MSEAQTTPEPPPSRRRFFKLATAVPAAFVTGQVAAKPMTVEERVQYHLEQAQIASDEHDAGGFSARLVCLRPNDTVLAHRRISAELRDLDEAQAEMAKNAMNVPFEEHEAYNERRDDLYQKFRLLQSELRDVEGRLLRYALTA